MYIVFFTKQYSYPQILTINLEWEECNKFFDTFCNNTEEIVSAILFHKTGDLSCTFNG